MLFRPHAALPGLTMPCPTTHGRQSPVRARPGDLRPVSHVPAIHLARQSPFYRPPGHIRSRDGIYLCPSSSANPSRHRSRAHQLARCFAGRSPTCHAQPPEPVPHFREIHLEPGSPFYAGTRHTPGPGDIKLCSPAPFSLANYLIINNGRFQVNFTKQQKKNTPDLTLNEARDQIVCRLLGVERKDIPPSESYAILGPSRAHRVAR